MYGDQGCHRNNFRPQNYENFKLFFKKKKRNYSNPFFRKKYILEILKVPSHKTYFACFAVSQDTDGYKFNSDRASIDEVLHTEVTEGIICGFVYDEPSESYIIWNVSHGKHQISRVGANPEKIFEGENIGWIGVNPSNKHVEIASNDGKFIDLNTKEELFKIDKFESTEVHFIQVCHGILVKFKFFDFLRLTLDDIYE